MENNMRLAHKLFNEPQMIEAAQTIGAGDRSKLEAMKRSGFDINQQGAQGRLNSTYMGILCRNERL